MREAIGLVEMERQGKKQCWVWDVTFGAVAGDIHPVGGRAGYLRRARKTEGGGWSVGLGLATAVKPGMVPFARPNEA